MLVCSSRVACETHTHQRSRTGNFEDMSAEDYFQYWMRWMPYPSLDTYTDHRHRCVTNAHTAMKALEAYSTRKLSFPQDALNAVSGILKLFAKHGVHHIWGAPCFFSGNIYAPDLCTGNSWLDARHPTRGVELALLMDNFYPCERRAGFPSWSPLGWSSPFQWTGGEGPDRLRTFPRLVTADASDISIRSGDEKYGLSELITRDSATIEDILSRASPYLEIVGRTVTLRLVEPRRDRLDPSVAFELHDGFYAIFHPRWTVSPTNPEIGSDIKGVLLLSARFMPSTVEQIHAMVLLLSDHGDHYEKVGDFELFKDRQAEHLWERWDEELHVWHGAGGSLASRLDQLGVDEQHDAQPVATEARTEEKEGDETASQDEQEYWWWKYFTAMETIVLG
jgi:hypothetical protein